MGNNNDIEKDIIDSSEELVVLEEKRAKVHLADMSEKASKAGKKALQFATVMLAQTASGSKVLADGIAKGTKDISDKAKMDSYNRRMKKYNPLFVEEYNSPEFFVPNIISIVDDAVRRDVDVCKGAIGWRENKKGTEVLFLYDEFVEKSGLKFIPAPQCDEIYYVDTFDRKCFVKLDYIFQKTHEEKLAELEHIAYALGAKSCSIEIEEKEVQHVKKKKSGEAKEDKTGMSATETYDAEVKNDSSMHRFSKSETKFKGNDEIVMPTLKWYANDNNILNLIEYRCKGGNAITARTLKLSGSSSTTMSRKAAYSIDAAVADMGVNHSYGMEDKSVKESTTMIVYRLEF